MSKFVNPRPLGYWLWHRAAVSESDSLFGGNRTVGISPGSFIVFIGDPAAVFVAQTT